MIWRRSSRLSAYCRNGQMLGAWSVKTHLPAIFADFAAAAPVATTEGGSPLRSSGLSITSW